MGNTYPRSIATDGIQPDLCVALGASLQAGVLVGEAVDAILVDVIPHSLGISAAINTPMGIMPGFFSVIIPRNSVIPVSRSEVYSTMVDNQEAVEIEVFQGENPAAEENVPLGSFRVENLPPKSAGSVQVEVHFDFDLNGILTVTATEKGKGQQGSLIVNNTVVHRLSNHEIHQARADLEALFESDETIEIRATNTSAVALNPELAALVERAQVALKTLDDERAAELHDLLGITGEQSNWLKLEIMQRHRCKTSKQSPYTTTTLTFTRLPDNCGDFRESFSGRSLPGNKPRSLSRSIQLLAIANKF